MHSFTPFVLLFLLGLAASSPVEERDDIPYVNIPDLFDGSLGELPVLWLMTQASFAELQAEHDRESRFAARGEISMAPNSSEPRVQTTRGHDGVVFTTTLAEKKRDVVTVYGNAAAPTQPADNFVTVTVTAGETPAPTDVAGGGGGGSDTSRTDKENASAFASFLGGMLIPSYLNIRNDGIMKGLCKSVISSGISMAGSIVTQEMTKDLYGADTTASEFEQGLVPGLFFGSTVKEGANAALYRNICKRVIPDLESLFDTMSDTQRSNIGKLAPRATRRLLNELLRKHGQSDANSESTAEDLYDAIRLRDHIKHPIKTAKNFEKNLALAKRRFIESTAKRKFAKEKTIDAFRNLIKRTSRELGHGSSDGLDSNEPIKFLKAWAREHSKILKKKKAISKTTEKAFKNLKDAAETLASKLKGVCKLKRSEDPSSFFPRSLEERDLFSCADELRDAARGAQRLLDKVNPWAVDDLIKDGINPTNPCDEPPEPPNDPKPPKPAEPVEPPWVPQPEPPNQPPISDPVSPPIQNPESPPPLIYNDGHGKSVMIGPEGQVIYVVGTDGLPLPVNAPGPIPVPVPVAPSPVPVPIVPAPILPPGAIGPAVRYKDWNSRPDLLIYTDTYGKHFTWVNGVRTDYKIASGYGAIPEPITVPIKVQAQEAWKAPPEHYKRHMVNCNEIGHSYCAWTRAETKALCKNNNGFFQVRMFKQGVFDKWGFQIGNPSWFECDYGSGKDAAKYVEKNCFGGIREVVIGADNAW